MSVTVWNESDPPTLTTPTLIAAFEGWNDSGQAATGAVDAIIAETGATEVGHIDPEEFYDFQMNRPVVSREHGERIFTWPQNTLYAVGDGEATPGILLLRGVEPSFRWRTFCTAVIDVARTLKVANVVTFGGLSADTPHTRPSVVSGTSEDAELLRKYDLTPSTYQGESGIVGALHHTAQAEGIPSVTYWAGVPHYLASAVYHDATLALLKAAEPFIPRAVDLTSVELASVAQHQEIAELVDDDPDLAEYIADLEERSDAENGRDLPMSGDELAAAFEKYLQNRDT